MSLVRTGTISSNDQKVDKKKFDACPLWNNLKKAKKAKKK